MNKLNKICIHWTAGASKPCEKDLNSYHYLFDDVGNEYKGRFNAEDNIDCKDNIYAKHCGGGNTGCIGMAATGMAKFNLKIKKTNYPLTQIQIEKLCYKAAKLCIKHNIQVNSKYVFTHYEFGLKNPHTTSAGKIDFTYIPYLPHLQKERIGDYLRNKILWYQLKIQKEENSFK